MNPENAQESDITAWLKSLGLEQYAETFVAQDLTLEIFRELSDTDLKECGVTSLGHRRQLLSAIKKLTPVAASAKEQSPAVAPAANKTPKRLGHYEVLEQIGKGGFGRVFRAWDTRLERQVALKILDKTIASEDPKFAQDFIREAKNAAGINHPNVVQIYFAGEDQGEFYIAMELIEGQDMAERLERGPLDEKLALKMARQVVEALSATNARRVVHGDIKPHNIYLGASGDAKLLDFGLARKSKAGTSADGGFTGSAHYVSPERVQLQPEDFRSDIYSLGATLFEALSGLPPFDAESAAELAQKRLNEDAPRLRSVKPNVSESLDWLVARMLERDADKRHPSYDALLADIAAAQRVGQAAPKLPPPTSLRHLADHPAMRAVPTEINAEGGEAPTHPQLPRRKLWQRLRGSRFFWVSVALHAIFLMVATYLVVQTITAQRKLTFKGGPPSPNPSQRAVEHKVQLAKKQNTMSAPAQSKRITTTGLSKIALPDMPAVSMDSMLSPSRMSGMGGSMGLGAVSGVAGGTGSAGRGGVTAFGFRAGDGLAGTFYDLKQDKDGKPTEMAARPGEAEGWDGRDAPANKAYDKALGRILAYDLKESALRDYFKGPQTLYTTQIYIPSIPAGDAPKSFNLADRVQGKRWAVVYRGKVIPPESGSYRFVGFGDDILLVRFNDQVVLDASMFAPTKRGEFQRGPVIGKTFEVRSGSSYTMEILIGERPGGVFNAHLLLEKEGMPQGDKRPIFKLAPGPVPPRGDGVPEVAPDTSWSVWKSQARSGTF